MCNELAKIQKILLLNPQNNKNCLISFLSEKISHQKATDMKSRQQITIRHRGLLFCLLLTAGMWCHAPAQTIPTYNLHTVGNTKPADEAYQSYDVGVHYMINLTLPDVENAPESERKVLSAIRDTVLNRVFELTFIPGDTRYAELIKQYRKNMNDFLVELMTPFDEESLYLYKCYIDANGILSDIVDGKPLDKKQPFISYYLSNVRLVGNTITSYEMLTFDRKTGQLLTAYDLLDFTNDNQIKITKLIEQEFYKNHPEKVPYDDNIYSGVSFEICKDGLKYYIPTDNLKDPLVYVFIPKKEMMPFVKKGSLLYRYWK